MSHINPDSIIIIHYLSSSITQLLDFNLIMERIEKYNGIDKRIPTKPNMVLAAKNENNDHKGFILSLLEYTKGEIR